jgi:hypothetical protein
VAGIWTIETPGLTVISGSATVKLKAKVNSGDAWTEITSFPHRGAYRYFTVSITSTGTFKIEERASIAVKVLADVKREFGLVTASAVAAATVTLTGKYIRFRSLILTPYGASSARARVATYANLTLSESGTNSFDVYLYDGSGSRVGSEDVAYSFEGI